MGERTGRGRGAGAAEIDTHGFTPFCETIKQSESV